MSLEKNLAKILEEIEAAAHLAGRRAHAIKLVAVSKGRSVEEIREAYNLGLRDFAENRVQEALAKMELLPGDIRWHFIGKLQKNKVSKVIGKFALIHSIDSPELAVKLSFASAAQQIVTPILLEVNTSGEATKSGLSPSEWQLHYPELLKCRGIAIQGLMTMAPFTENEGTVRHCFSELRRLMVSLSKLRSNLDTLSMGMTSDFSLAIQEGATLVRIGTALFEPS